MSARPKNPFIQEYFYPNISKFYVQYVHIYATTMYACMIVCIKLYTTPSHA